MDSDLFIGSSQDVRLDAVLDDACLRLAQLGIHAASGDLIAVRHHDDPASLVVKGFLSDYSVAYLFFRNSRTYVHLTQFKTEIVAGFSLILEPLTIGVSVWVGADATNHLITACVAAAIASKVGGEILDSEHKWSDVDLNDVDRLLRSAKEKYRLSV